MKNTYISELDASMATYKQKMNSIQYQQLSVPIAEYQELSEFGSDDLKITGVALTEGAHKNGVFYSALELRKASKRLIGKQVFFNKKTDGLFHNINDAENRVGYITNSYYDEGIKGIRYEATITDMSIKDKIKQKAINFVSVGVASFKKVIDHVNHGVDLFFKEMSLVLNPADKKTTLEVATNV